MIAAISARFAMLVFPSHALLHITGIGIGEPVYMTKHNVVGKSWPCTTRQLNTRQLNIKASLANGPYNT